MSIVITVGSLALAFALARRRTPIRVGFDAARAVVGVGAIVAVASLARTWAPPAAVVPAIAAGLGLGFAQGAALRVSPGAGGFFARRSPVAMALWGVGILVVQVAGIAARTGLVQAGQTIAWFSACLGIGLIFGRNRPLRRARQASGGAAAAVLLALALTAVIAGGAGPQHALAAPEDLTAEQLCDLYPQDQGFRFQANPAVQTCWADFGDCDGAVPEPSDCGSGIIKQEATAEDAWDNLTRHTGGYQESLAGLGEAAIGGCDSYCTVEFVRGRFWVWWSVDPELGLESARALAAQVDARLVALLGGEPPLVTTTSGGTSTTAPATTSAGGTTSTLPSEPGEPSGGESEPITPQEAAAQAIAGLIAAAAIGAISWVEAAAGIQEILGGADAGAPPEPPSADTAAAAATPAEEPPTTGRRVDPCAFQQERYEGALGDWQRIQSEIDALRGEYRALQLQIEADWARDSSGAVFDLGMMGKDLLGAELPTPGVFKAMVEAAKQEFGRAVVKQLIQAAAAGQTPDPEAILYGAADGAVGASDLVSGKLPGGAFGEFFSQSITALLAANKAYDCMKLIDTLAEPGAIADPELVRALEQSTFEIYFKRVGPWVGVVTKAIDLYYKNKDWGEGVERRNGMRAELTRLGTRIGELEYDLGYASEARDSYLGFLSRCREETR